MRKSAPSDVDLRGFSWPLAAVARQVDAAAQRALADLASQQRCRAAGEAALQALRSEHDDQIRSVPALDVALRRHGIAYLAGAAQRLDDQERAQVATSVRTEAARQAHQALQQRLEALARLRGEAMARHAGQERRRAANEADQAFLASRLRARARQRQESRP